MKIILFSGFLGSGKTSVILQLAKYMVETRQEKVAIVENEIGETGIDDQLMKQQGLEVKGIFAGCVCCQVTGDLMVAVREIYDSVAPDWLIIEATGLANPDPIVKFFHTYCADLGQLNTITVVDAERWPELYEIVENLMLSQVSAAQVILLNKIDLISDSAKAEVKQTLTAINPGAALLAVSAAQAISNDILKELSTL